MFDINAACGAQRSQGQTLTFSPDLVSGRHSLVMPLGKLPKNGGDGRDRTDDLMLAKQLLSQLSYVP